MSAVGQSGSAINKLIVYIPAEEYVTLGSKLTESNSPLPKSQPLDQNFYRYKIIFKILI